MSRKLSVVICVYNEAENIQPLIERLLNALQGIDCELYLLMMDPRIRPWQN